MSMCGCGKEWNRLKGMALIISLFSLLLFAGCNQERQKIPTYRAVGEIETVEKTEGIIDGVKTLYSVKLINLQPGSIPDPGDVSAMFLAITKNTAIYRSSGGKKLEADNSAVEKGKQAEIIWRFANEHLTEAVEIDIK